MLNKIREDSERVLMWRPCRTCDGKGVIARPRSTVDDEPVHWVQVGEGETSSNHLDEALVKWTPCPNCEGQQRTAQWVSRAEYRLLRRRAIVRGLFLFFAGAIPFIALALAIATSENSMLCGSWWYGLLSVTFVLLT